ncbi:flagellin [Parendozoicomonas haliclonae]|uniref:Flagellin n=1 Tax=Parendozoicomonas haliclonae TaxID=1960125 RepID=A0A1X7AQI2_9GAMM|nr:flagellin [Parendozoicomonas haliclonae]SMA49667.1 A-type flagellin [Parendozoicomonas haliclonae]
MITINTNTTAMIAQNNLLNTQKGLTSSMERLSTGLRINSASDDAAGMQISNRMQTQRNGLDVAMRNANDAISMAQTAEGAMSENTDILNRMRDLALQSANDSNTDGDRAAMQKEVDALKEEITRIHNTTNFAGKKLLNGDAGALSFQVGSNSNETIEVKIDEISTSSLKGKISEDLAAGNVTIDSKQISDALTKANNNGSAAGSEVKFSIGTTDGTTPAVEEITLAAKAANTPAEDAYTLEDIVDAINAKTDDSGVSAVADSNGGITLSTKGINAIAVEEETAGTIVDKTGVAGKTAGSELTVADIDLKTAAGAQAAVDILDGALKQVDEQRANLGAVQNRLESTIDNLSNINENLTQSQSRIKDVDFAKETTNMTSKQMMMQAGSTVLSQAKGMSQYATMLMG